ncbi:PAS domain S-box protein [Anaerobacillus sp. CMMVII]|uniref:PAS domain-containing protein n=1 Tax=Anaerobacillus sp. CMMVII TaxID=2755588 RepID=UPI0021B70AB8|nr:PAS domain S-box protein [Anaerobacillus sp. CMMVII]MCT8137777.1 PAS domain S-box protein [Anaerobacillus sp. CMMVII]
MNFTGRISATIPILIICIWLLQHTIKDDGTAKFIVSLTIAIIAIVIAWNFGRQYDKAKFYYKELLINKEDLQKKKDDLQQIFDSVDATIWSNDIVNQRIYVSKGIERLTGYTVQQFYNEYSFWTSILHPDDVTKGEEFLKEIILGKSAQIELRYVNTSGETCWLLMSGTPIFASGSKEVVKITGVVVDITERKKTEGRLQESEIRYRSVVELSPNIILIIQEDIIVYTNPTTVKILGLSDASEILGESIYDFLDPAVKNKVINRKNEIYMEKAKMFIPNIKS